MDDLSGLPVMVLNMKQNRDRLERVQQRLKHHGLGNIHVIRGVSHDEPDDGLKEFLGPTPEQFARTERQYAAVFFDHIRALRQFVHETTAPAAFIMEDDVMLRKGFLEIIAQAVHSPKQYGLILFSPYYTNPSCIDVCHWVEPGVFRISPGIFSSACYYVSRAGAISILKQRDFPFGSAAQPYRRMSSEDFLMDANPAVFMYPPLAVEECFSTHIQPDAGLVAKRDYWKQFGIESDFLIPNEPIPNWLHESETWISRPQFAQGCM